MKKLLAAAALTAAVIGIAQPADAHWRQPPPAEASVDGVTVRACHAGGNLTRFQVLSTTETHGYASVGIDRQFYDYFVHADTLMTDVTVETRSRWLWVIVQSENDDIDFGADWPSPLGRWLWVTVPCSRVGWAS